MATTRRSVRDAPVLRPRRVEDHGAFGVARSCRVRVRHHWDVLRLAGFTTFGADRRLDLAQPVRLQHRIVVGRAVDRGGDDFTWFRGEESPILEDRRGIKERSVGSAGEADDEVAPAIGERPDLVGELAGDAHSPHVDLRLLLAGEGAVEDAVAARRLRCRHNDARAAFLVASAVEEDPVVDGLDG